MKQQQIVEGALYCSNCFSPVVVNEKDGTFECVCGSKGTKKVLLSFGEMQAMKGSSLHFSSQLRW